jgi:hypothetical protein
MMRTANSVEFLGGPKDGETIYSRPSFLPRYWVERTHNIIMASEPDTHYTYELEVNAPYFNYRYLGITIKRQ